MAKIIIGETEYVVPELNLIALERVWPFIEEVRAGLSPMKAISAGIAIIAAGLIEGEGFNPDYFGMELAPKDQWKANGTFDERVFNGVQHFLKKKLKASQIQNVTACVDDILMEAGVLEEGEIEAAGRAVMAELLSMETSPTSSPSSSPQDAKEEAGTA